MSEEFEKSYICLSPMKRQFVVIHAIYQTYLRY